MNLSYTSIISPIDGVVISRSVDVGQTVAASLSAPMLFTIAQDLTKMQVDTNVSEGDVGRLQVGMKTYFTVDAYPGQRFIGKIRQIRNAATTVQNVVTYDAVIDVDNSDLRLRPGMTANVTVVYAERRGVLAVSNAALRFRPPPALAGSASAGGAGSGEGRHRLHPRGAASAAAGDDAPEGKDAKAPKDEAKTVWVLRGGGAPQLVPVHTGLTDGTVTEIVDGDLNEGDPVVVDTVQRRRERAVGAAPRPPATALLTGRLDACPTASSSSPTSPRSTRPGTSRCARSTASRSTSRRASSSPSWAPRAPASRPDEHPRLPRPAHRRAATCSPGSRSRG